MLMSLQYVSFTKQMKKKAKSLDVDLLLIDTGVRQDFPQLTTSFTAPRSLSVEDGARGFSIGATLTSTRISTTGLV